MGVSVRDMIILAEAEVVAQAGNECTFSPAVYGAQRRDKVNTESGSRLRQLGLLGALAKAQTDESLTCHLSHSAPTDPFLPLNHEL